MVQTFPYFLLISDKLYTVSRDTQTGGATTQWLVPTSLREMVFQAAHFNPMVGHLGYEKTLSRMMTWFYWLGIRGEVCRLCASFRECQLVNQTAIPRAPLRPLSLTEVPFESIVMDLIGPFHRSARGSLVGIWPYNPLHSRWSIGRGRRWLWLTFSPVQKGGE